MKTLPLRSLVAGAALSLGAVALSPIGTQAAAPSFLGKGDVQLALGLNNAQLQSAAPALTFRVVSQSVTEYSWTCVNDNNDKVQLRSNVVITSVETQIDSVSRDRRNNVTGFFLAPSNSATTTVSHEGPKPDSCPAGPWEFSGPVESDEAATQTAPASELQVTVDGGNWVRV
jgi:hypothetical protein